MKNFISFISKAILPLLAIVLSGCNLDVINPNNPKEEQILSSRDGLLNFSVGMRQVYSTSTLGSIILTPGTTARELRGITTFTNIIEIDQGGSLLPNFNGNILGVWSRCLRVISMTDDIISNAPIVLVSDPATLSGVVSHAKLFKAMCLGGLAQSFTHAVLTTDKRGQAVFVTRGEALAEAIRLLKQAELSLVSIAPSAEFNTKVTGTEFNLLNSVRAYLARYSLMNGDYAGAISAARSVDRTIASSFIFTVLAPNPVFNAVQVSRDYAPRDAFGLPASLIEAGDGRVAFYLINTSTNISGDPTDGLRGFATTNSSPIPVYLPDEMRLIVAEAIVRSGGILSEAVTEINAVRTQTTGDPFGVHAGLPAYSGTVDTPSLLTEIYKQRCTELFLSGLRLEDSRRFGRTAPPPNVNPVPLTFERSRDFYPFPQQERQNNLNTPADPTI
jgi:starch-binding outer membrane protein, SusD/RagB family